MNLGQGQNNRKMANSVNNKNIFSLGSQVGGSDAANATRQDEQQLRDLINEWTGDYSADVKEFAFLVAVDGEVHTYTKLWNMVGAQEARRKKNWIEAEIVVPESWWRDGDYKQHLATEIEKALYFMIGLLQRNKRDVKADVLLADWTKIRKRYLRDSSSPRRSVQ
jgi:hypothetical protein